MRQLPELNRMNCTNMRFWTAEYHINATRRKLLLNSPFMFEQLSLMFESLYVWNALTSIVVKVDSSIRYLSLIQSL